tara:strand:- start:492 stop:737 length:246 start_codon:yes stop_codon:yes gene_type:complete
MSGVAEQSSTGSIEAFERLFLLLCGPEALEASGGLDALEPVIQLHGQGSTALILPLPGGICEGHENPGETCDCEPAKKNGH